MKRQVRGSCHCGRVRFAAGLEQEHETSRCNCSICLRQRFWKAILRAADFGVDAGEDALGEYKFGGGNIRHFFCATCGVKVFGRGNFEPIGDFVAVNVGCLDLTAEDLAALPVVFQDGAHDRWDRAPAHVGYL
jgi:hypothetical protein